MTCKNSVDGLHETLDINLWVKLYICKRHNYNMIMRIIILILSITTKLYTMIYNIRLGGATVFIL